MRELILDPVQRTIREAKNFAEAVHEGQLDKAGEPYSDHLDSVAYEVARMRVEVPFDRLVARQVAWLHDVIEDTPYDGAHLRREGFSEEVVSAVEWLTKPKDEPYAAWIDRLCADAPLTALIVKLADLEDNLAPDRLGKLDAATQDRLRRKYEPAREKVRAAIQGRASPRA